MHRRTLLKLLSAPAITGFRLGAAEPRPHRVVISGAGSAPWAADAVAAAGAVVAPPPVEPPPHAATMTVAPRMVASNRTRIVMDPIALTSPRLRSTGTVGTFANVADAHRNVYNPA